MNDLRLILLLLGVALILGIYLWESYQQRDMRRRRTIAQDTPSFDLPPLRPARGIPLTGELDEVAAPAEERMPIMGNARQDATAQPPERIPAAPSAATGMPAADGILTLLYVAAAQGRPFTGRAILDAMRAADLRYGDMKVFHRYRAQSGPSPELLFSVADMFEPGHFDLDAMDEFSTRGLSLFMHARPTADPKTVFEDMLGAAELLARILGGEVLGADRKTLDAGRVAGIRARLGR